VGTDDDLRPPPELRSPRRPEAVPLTTATVEEFLRFAAQAGEDEIPAVREQIAGADTAVIEVLAERLVAGPVEDVGRHLVLLAVIGEAQHPPVLAPLRDFVWAEKPWLVDERHAHESPAEDDAYELLPCQLDLELEAPLRGRAAEMLTYLGTPEALEAAEEILRSHPEPEVRRATIDALLYHHGDTEEAKERLHRVVREEDQPFVGLPRRTREMDAEEFDRRVQEHYEPPPTPDEPRPREEKVKRERPAPSEHPPVFREEAPDVP
jgi:hypothetical protein